MKKLLVALLVVLAMFGIAASSLAETAMTPQVALGIIKGAFADENGIAYSFTYDENSAMYYMNVTIDGMAARSVDAENSAAAKEEWTGIRDALQSMGAPVQDLIRSLTEDDAAMLTIMVYNDVAVDKVLISMTSDAILFDVVAGEGAATK